MPESKSKVVVSKPSPAGYEVYHWPEFKAFAERLGIAWDLRTRHLRIEIAMDESVVITQEYLANEGPEAAPLTCFSRRR